MTLLRATPILSPEPRVEAMLPLMAASVTAEWMFRLDDDELPSSELLTWLETASADRLSSKLIGFSRRSVSLQSGIVKYATKLPAPYDPMDYQFRLFQPKTAAFVSTLHTPGVVNDDRYLAPPECCIYHFDRLVRGKAQRTEKLMGYVAQGGSLADQFAVENASDEAMGWVPLDDLKMVSVAKSLARRQPIYDLGRRAVRWLRK